MQVKVKKLNKGAKLPTRGSQYAAGSDVYSFESTVVPAKGRAIISTGISIEFENTDYYCRIAPRSGLAAKYGIDTLAGVVDVDYRGEVKVILYNTTDSIFEIHAGDRIAQLIFERITYPNFEEVNELNETVRGTGGFGSTGN